MHKYEITAKVFTTINMYREHGLTIEEICDLLSKQDNLLSKIQESFDDQKTARKIFDETYRPQAISHRVEDFRTMLVEIGFFDLYEAEYDEDGKLISDRKLLDRAVEALQPEDQEKNSYEKIGYWKGNMDLTRFKIEKKYELSWEINERRRRFRREGDIQIPLIKFTDRHKKDLYGRVFALYGYINEGRWERFYRFCWEVNPDNLNEAVDENKIYILNPFHKPTYGYRNGVHWDGETAEPVDFEVYGPNSEFVVYVAEFDVPDDFTQRYTTEEEIEWIFDRHPAPNIKEAGRFTTPKAAYSARYNIITNEDFDQKRKNNRVYFRVCYIQEENERGKRRLSFYAHTLYDWDK